VTAPTTVDLALPSNEQLLAAAAPNPETEAARLTATGNPDQVADVGARLQRTGTELDQVYRQSTQTQQVLGGSFANNGAPVYDAQTHRESLPPGFADAGTRLHDAGRRVALLSLELKSAIDDVNAAQSRLFRALNGRRLSFAAEVDGARGAGGLIPVEQVPALQARRARVAADMQQLVNTCGRDVVTRIGRYEGVLDDSRRLLGLTTTGPAAADTSGTQLDPILGGQLEGGQVSGLTVPTPAGPTSIIDPIPDPPLPIPGFTPAPAGPGPLITVPTPDLGTGVHDGPGSGQRQDEPPIKIYTDSSTGPTGGFTGPISGGRPHRGDFPRTAEPDGILVRTGNDGKVNSYEVYGPDGLPMKRVDVRGRAHGGIPTPHVQEFERNTDPATGREFITKGEVREVTPDEVAGLE
jgi:Bacterial toxin 24